MSERHTVRVTFHIGSQAGWWALGYLWPVVRRLPERVAQGIVDLLLRQSHSLWSKDGGPWNREPGWQVRDGELVLDLTG